MKRTEELECKLDALLEEFSDMSCEDIADILDYRASEYQNKANRTPETFGETAEEVITIQDIMGY